MHKSIKIRTPDIVIPDLQLPGKHGLELAMEIRRDSDIGIIILTGTGDKFDEIVGLEGGADDYLLKPVEERELLARVRALRRRLVTTSDNVDNKDKSIAKFSGWIMDFDAYELISPTGESVGVTSYEFQILATLVQNSNRVLSRNQIMENSTGRDRDWMTDDRSVDVLIGKLRKKIEEDPHNPSMIKTIRGAGYKFTARVKYS
ncbi:MAG: response regulator transcription factor [Proteobacteria bacterium]|nr:response regulator transcription factor [Pseudomonadota bacterium]